MKKDFDVFGVVEGRKTKVARVGSIQLHKKFTGRLKNEPNIHIWINKNLGWVRVKDAERLAVNILKMINSKKLK